MDIQARLYWRIIRNNLDKNEFFREYKLTNYKFVVVNKKTLTPLVWDCPFTQATGTLNFGDNNQIVLRDPEVIGKELTYYLSNKPRVPLNINTDSPNNLGEWLNTL